MLLPLSFERQQKTNRLRARLAVLDSCSVVFTRLADLLQTSGWIGRDRKELAAALLMRLASELAGGISLLIQNSHLYAAGALLRQLIEVEYLLFLGCADPTTFKVGTRLMQRSFASYSPRNK